MRRALATLGAVCVLAAWPAGSSAEGIGGAKGMLRAALNQYVEQAGSSSGAYVVDLNTGQVLFSSAAGVGRLPASVEKVYTTSTALLRFGPNATLTTTIRGTGVRGPRGTWYGTLYLRGGGDPTFGSATFDQDWYGSGTGTTIQRAVGDLTRAAHIAAVRGSIVGDESYFDSLRGTPATGFAPSLEVEGELSALAYDRGYTDLRGEAFQGRPALTATEQFVAALQAAKVRVPAATPIFTGRTPAAARLLTTVHSPRIATLIRLTNTPSDNYFAETLLKDLGARFGGAGSTAAGASVVRAELASKFGIHPQLDDGSGLSRADSTSPRQVVTVLTKMATDPYFVNSLAVAGQSGTLQDEMTGTPAQGRCRGKTGTLHDVANLVGYCRARDGHTLAFAFLVNGIDDPDYVHDVLEAEMAVAVAQYSG